MSRFSCSPKFDILLPRGGCVIVYSVFRQASNVIAAFYGPSNFSMSISLIYFLQYFLGHAGAGAQHVKRVFIGETVMRCEKILFYKVLYF